MYLLAKKLPHTLVSDQNDEFKKLLAQTEAKDIVAFAQAVGQQAKDIDTKVCKDKKKGTSDTTGSENGQQGRWSCINGNGTGDAATYKTFSERFGELAGHDKRVKGDSGNKTPTGWPGTESSTHDTANAVADELSKGLDRNQRNTVAGLLSKTVSGAEVVEIRAVSTTSVMLNACYDKRKGAVALRSLFSCSSSYMNIFFC